jgi:hypothetical protein
MKILATLVSSRVLPFVFPVIPLLLLEMFQWDMIDWFTPFLIVPLFGILWLIVAIAVVASLVFAYRHRSEGRRALAPFAGLLVAVLVAVFFPFTDIWLTANFHLKKASRERVVAEVASGKLVPNVSHNRKLIALPRGTRVSKGGDEIVVEGSAKEAYVFFFTYRGILDHYSGFLWVPDGGNPQNFRDAGEEKTQIRSFGGNWYFVGHR